MKENCISKEDEEYEGGKIGASRKSLMTEVNEMESKELHGIEVEVGGKEGRMEENEEYSAPVGESGKAFHTAMEVSYVDTTNMGFRVWC